MFSKCPFAPPSLSFARFLPCRPSLQSQNQYQPKIKRSKSKRNIIRNQKCRRRLPAAAAAAAQRKQSPSDTRRRTQFTSLKITDSRCPRPENVERYGMGSPIWHDLPKTMITTANKRKCVRRTGSTKKNASPGTTQNSIRYRLRQHYCHRHRLHRTTRQLFIPRKNYSREKRTPSRTFGWPLPGSILGSWNIINRYKEIANARSQRVRPPLQCRHFQAHGKLQGIVPVVFTTNLKPTDQKLASPASPSPMDDGDASNVGILQENKQTNNQVKAFGQRVRLP